MCFDSGGRRDFVGGQDEWRLSRSMLKYLLNFQDGDTSLIVEVGGGGVVVVGVCNLFLRLFAHEKRDIEIV